MWRLAGIKETLIVGFVVVLIIGGTAIYGLNIMHENREPEPLPKGYISGSSGNRVILCQGDGIATDPADCYDSWRDG